MTTPPILDFRNAEAFYGQTLALAQQYTPQWSRYWPPGVVQSADAQDPNAAAQAINQDPGLVLLNLFAQMAGYTATIENQIPYQRRQAFFQFMGMQLRPPLPALAPLHFTLKPGQPARLVPAQTAVLDADAHDIRFQTNQELLVVPASLCAAMTLIPAQDQYIDAMPVLDAAALPRPLPPSVPIFVADDRPDPAETPLGHWFILGDAQLFKPDPALQSVTVTLYGTQLHAQYFGQWFDGALNPLAVRLEVSDDARQLEITLLQLPLAAPRTIDQLLQQIYAQEDPGAGFTAPQAAANDQLPEYWLLVKPDPQVKVLAALAEQLPVITGLQCTFRGDGIPAQQAACNVVLLDIRNGAYPFGETPQTSDAFYLRNDAVFGRAGARIALSFDLVPVQTQSEVQLYWQFWNGTAWQSLNQTLAQISQHQFVDTTHNLRYNNPDGPTWVQFECPPMQETTVAGGKGLWIRALIATGGYGEAGGFVTTSVADTIAGIPDKVLPAENKGSVIAYLNDVEGINFSYHFNQAQFYPPFVRSLRIGYSYAAQPTRYWSYNAFELSRFLFSPFKPVAAELTGFYFAFATGSFGVETVGRRLNLYVHLERECTSAGTALQWQYHDGQAWLALAVDDGTQGLSRSGIVSFIVPAAMQAATLYSQQAYWFRADNPHVERTVRLYGLYPNTVMASGLTGVDDEVLGSSNEQPGQQFSLNYPPVLPAIDLRVLETRAIEALAPDPSPGATAAAMHAAASLPQPWRQVDSFALCGPSDRVYTLDCQNGLVTFGDGYNGRIPPAGYNNIVVAHYDSTRGIAGNVARDRLTLLRPGISGIDAVTNPAPASGGVDGDTSADIAVRSPALVKANGYAVQLCDLSALAAQASQQVAQARAIETAQQTIRIVLLAQSQAAVPYTTPAILTQVAQAVRAQCLAALAPRIDTVAPDFVAIDIDAQLQVDCPPDQRGVLQQRLVEQLLAFLQPVFGGPTHTGWRFGQPVQAMTVNRFLRTLPEVTAVLALSLNGHLNGDIGLEPGQLPVAGQVSLLLYTG